MREETSRPDGQCGTRQRKNTDSFRHTFHDTSFSLVFQDKPVGHQLIERTTHGWPGDPVHNAQFMFGGQQIARRIDSLGDMAAGGFRKLVYIGAALPWHFEGLIQTPESQAAKKFSRSQI